MQPLYGALSAVCSSAGYTRCFGRTSVHLCASSLLNLAVPQDFFPLHDLGDPLFDGVGLEGFKSRADAFLLA